MLSHRFSDRSFPTSPLDQILSEVSVLSAAPLNRHLPGSAPLCLVVKVRLGKVLRVPLANLAYHSGPPGPKTPTYTQELSVK